MTVNWHPLLLDDGFVDDYISQAPIEFITEMSLDVDEFDYATNPLTKLLLMWQRIPEQADRGDVKTWKKKLIEQLGGTHTGLGLIAQQGVGAGTRLEGHFSTRLEEFITDMSQWVSENNIDISRKTGLVKPWFKGENGKNVFDRAPSPESFTRGQQLMGLFNRYYETIPWAFFVDTWWPLINWDKNPLEMK
tara:strand:- start:5455 stop:6027 length:573 start_codon:yes stop_codon:yes gene_type:complete